MSAEDIDVGATLATLAAAVAQLLESRARAEPLIVGIRTGGVWVAEHVHRHLGLTEPLGMLNINFYRDDFTRIGMHPRVDPSRLPFTVDDRHVVLVDDVLHTGRTVRAALNEIFDYGRPASVALAVLVERAGREIPIQADACGTSLPLEPDEYVKLTGPSPLALEIRRHPRAGG